MLPRILRALINLRQTSLGCRPKWAKWSIRTLSTNLTKRTLHRPPLDMVVPHPSRCRPFPEQCLGMLLVQVCGSDQPRERAFNLWPASHARRPRRGVPCLNRQHHSPFRHKWLLQGNSPLVHAAVTRTSHQSASLQSHREQAQHQASFRIMRLILSPKPGHHNRAGVMTTTGTLLQRCPAHRRGMGHRLLMHTVW